MQTTARAALIGVATGLVLGALAVIYTRDPCPPCPQPMDTGATILREVTRDSLAHERRIRARILDSLNAISPANRYDINLRISRSLSRTAQLDSLRADPS